MYKRILGVLVLLLSVVSLRAQIQNPVSWSFSQKALSGNEVELTFTATVESGWHMYSQFVADGGPIPTSFKFEKNPAVQVEGKVSEPKPTEEFDKNFGITLKYFSGKVVFKQKVKVNAATTVFKGTVEYMSCDDHQCTPPQETDFSFKLKGIAGAATTAATPATAGNIKGGTPTAAAPAATTTADPNAASTTMDTVKKKR